jgi:hypothetical protein
MSPRVRRLLFAGLLAALTCAAIIGGSAAGAASAPAPVSETQVTTPPSSAVGESEPLSEADARPQSAPHRHGTIGVIVGIRPARIAIAVKSQDKPVIVGIRPATEVRVNRRQATLDDLHTGDVVLVVGRPGPRGNLVARAVVTMRPARPV